MTVKVGATVPLSQPNASSLNFRFVSVGAGNRLIAFGGDRQHAPANQNDHHHGRDLASGGFLSFQETLLSNRSTCEPQNLLLAGRLRQRIWSLVIESVHRVRFSAGAVKTA
jgi:hypothetical protein